MDYVVDWEQESHLLPLDQDAGLKTEDGTTGGVFL